MRMIFKITQGPARVVTDATRTPGPRPRPDTRGDCRCTCGNLVARLNEQGVELKCRRCKRLIVVPWQSMERGESRGPPR